MGTVQLETRGQRATSSEGRTEGKGTNLESEELNVWIPMSESFLKSGCSVPSSVGCSEKESRRSEEDISWDTEREPVRGGGG